MTGAQREPKRESDMRIYRHIEIKQIANFAHLLESHSTRNLLATLSARNNIAAVRIGATSRMDGNTIASVQ